MDIGAWLCTLSLGEFEGVFVDNAVDFDVLPELRETDLEKLGLPLGHRKRILKAIASLTTPPAPVLSARDLPQAVREEAERRPIAVMFCDLVDSTRLAATLDAEDWRELVESYFDEASQAVVAYGGHVLKKLGDGLMALFGFPRAQENDAERAARAALAILAAIEGLNARNQARGWPALRARIGLDSGPVVVDATGEVFGDTPNVAARALATADPDTIVMTVAMQRQVAGLFVVEDKGPHELKGVAGRPALYRLVRASGGGRRGGARSLTPFVGRQEDLDLLLRRWERARRGEGQFVQIVGEPGIGKSRLVQELHARISETPHTWLEWSSSQLLQNTPLHPVSEWGRLRFGGAEVAAEKRLAWLEHGLVQVGLDPREHAPILAPLLDIPLPEARAPKLSPEELRRRQHAAVVAWALAGARAQPMALVIEDLHWADPTTLDVLMALADLGASARLFIVMTGRPEFRPPWPARSHHASLSLVPLDRAEIVKMVGSIAERHALSREAVEGVSDRTGGVPLFVEEVTRLLLEGGPQTIPPTLQQSLAARLDRLGAAREVAQIGAVLGREFDHSLLSAVAGLPESSLTDALEKLVDADLLFLEGAGTEARYRFKHALIQDAAYESLLRARRQAMHRRAAEALLAMSEPKPELVAHHFTQAGEVEPAIDWWGRAGEIALSGSAFREAISHLGRAIEMADAAGAAISPHSAARRTKLQRDYAHAVGWGKGFVADETDVAFRRVQLLSDAGETPINRLRAHHGQFLTFLTRGELRRAQSVAEQFLEVALSSGASFEILHGRRLIGFAYTLQGKFLAGRQALEEGLAAAAANEGDEPDLSLGMDPFSAAKAVLAMADFALGEFARGDRLFDEALQRAERLAVAPSITNVVLQRLIIQTAFGGAEATEPMAAKLIAIGRQRKMDYIVCVGDVHLALAQGRSRDAAVHYAALQAALRNYEAQGNGVNLPFYLSLLAEAAARANDVAAALDGLNRATAFAEATGHSWADSLVLSTKGAILAAHGEGAKDDAERALRGAVEIASGRGARGFQLLAAKSLADFLISSDRNAEARQLLSEALSGFAPTSAMPTAAAAQAMLTALA